MIIIIALNCYYYYYYYYHYYYYYYYYAGKSSVVVNPIFLVLFQVMSVVGILADDADPLVSVMKVEKAPLESYADIGGLYEQVSL